MRRTASQPLLRHFLEDDEFEDEVLRAEPRPFRDVDPLTRQLSCISIPKRDSKKTCHEELSCGAWRQEQRSGAAKLKKQLKARWAIQKLIDEQLGRFRAHYGRAMGPTRMSGVADLLMPKWAPPHEVAAVFWLGDWRPSTVLELLRSIARSLGVWDPVGVERALSHLINDMRNEEAVIDEEMTELHSNCVLHLPFAPPRNHTNSPALPHVRSQLTKVHRVIVKAQNLRIKALELVVKKVLTQSDAAEFLVAFMGIQDVINEITTKFKTRNTLPPQPAPFKNSDSAWN